VGRWYRQGVTNAASCSVCGRTILKGERTRTYLTAEGEPRTVCDLCRSRAESLHWVWAEVANEQPLDPRRRRRGSLVGWLRGRARKLVPSGQQAGNGTEAAPDRNGSDGKQADPAPPRQRVPDPAARGAGVGRSGTGAESGTRHERAVARFNESSHARTVAGLTKTLGPPLVSIGAAAGSPNEIRLTVAWELSWYQWGVDLGEPSRAVYEIDKGHEISEIDASAQQWNAHAADGGGLRLGRAKPRAEGHPAGTER
jgi:hypothetical protein